VLVHTWRLCYILPACHCLPSNSYVSDPNDIPAVKALLAAAVGVEQVLDPAELNALYKEKGGRSRREDAWAHHAGRSGDLVCIAAAGSWFACVPSLPAFASFVFFVHFFVRLVVRCQGDSSSRLDIPFLVPNYRTVISDRKRVDPNLEDFCFSLVATVFI
jgi:hypothetical protein